MVLPTKKGKHPPFDGMQHSFNAWSHYRDNASQRADVIAEVEASRPDFDRTYEATTTKVPQPDFKPGGGLNKLVCVHFIET